MFILDSALDCIYVFTKIQIHSPQPLSRVDTPTCHAVLYAEVGPPIKGKRLPNLMEESMEKIPKKTTLPVVGRILQLLKHLGIQQAHIAGQVTADWRGLVNTHPVKVKRVRSQHSTRNRIPLSNVEA